MSRFAALAAVLLTLVVAAPAAATTFTVTDTADTSGDCVTPGSTTCTLRAALDQAALGPGGDEIALGAGRYRGQAQRRGQASAQGPARAVRAAHGASGPDDGEPDGPADQAGGQQARPSLSGGPHRGVGD